MICPACEKYVFERSPSECPNCHSRVVACKPCFGTGQVPMIESGTGRHGRHGLMECGDCKGHGLIVQ